MRKLHKTLLLIGLLFHVLGVFGQVQTYYQDIDLSKTGNDLYVELSDLLINTHSGVSYSAIWNILQQADLDPDDNSLTDVLLVYGFDDLDDVYTTDRTRDKNLICNFSGSCTGFWNREHVFPQSLADPPMSTSSIGTGTDAHNLRAADAQANSQRGNNQFAPGSGDPFYGGVDLYYPGDEWKGDVARIILYMFLRYQEECLPTYVGNDTTTYDTQIPDIFLEWNAEDEVSDFEINRNEVIYGEQGNRNPFIDNPYLATLIWGGPTAENTWPQNGSDIVFDTNFSTPENIAYINYTTTSTLTASNSIEIGRFILRDGGNSGDLDTKDTELTSLSFSVTGQEVIHKAALYQEGVFLSEILVDQHDIQFNNLQIEALDGAESVFSLYVSFENTVADQTQFVFRVREAVAEATGTSFAYANAGGAETSLLLDENRINVEATALNFAVQPSDVNLQSLMQAPPVVEAIDANGNVDLDFMEEIQLSTTSNFTTDSNSSQQAVLGESVFNNLAFDMVGPSFSLTASANGIAQSLESDSFAVIDAPVSMQVGEVFITEISDHPTFTLEFMELFNFSEKQIDLTGAKIVMLPDETVWGFGASSGNSIANAVIPPKSFVVISRGGTLTDFETAYGALPSNTTFIQGTQGMFFVPNSTREWQLIQGGTESLVDGNLIDDNVGFGVDANQRISRNLYHNSFIKNNSNTATPGSLDDLIYVDGDWVNNSVPDLNSEQKNVYFFDDYVLDSSFKAKETGIKSDFVLHLNGNMLEVTDHVHFESAAASTAQLADLQGGSVVGEAIVERFIPKRIDSVRAFRFISSSVGNVSLTDSWQQQTHITGAVGTVGEQSSNGLDYTLSGNPSLFTYNETWNPVLETLTTALVPGRGYRMFIRGDRSVTLNNNNALANDVKLSAKGNLATGNLVAPDISTIPNKYSFVGNPYQSIVDLSQLNYGSGILSDYAYYWDASLANQGAFVSIDISTNTSSIIDTNIPDPGSSNVNRFLQPGQAVFFQNDGSGSGYNISFTESSKASQENSLQVFSTSTTPYINIRIYEQHKFQQGYSEQDATGIRFYETEADVLPQASKLGNLNENLAFDVGPALLSIYNTTKPDVDTVYPLFLNNLENENYVFQYNINHIDNAVEVRLYDAYLDESIVLHNGENIYAFGVDTSVPESLAYNRFSLVYEQTNLGTDLTDYKDFSFYPNPANQEFFVNLPQKFNEANLRMYNLQGQIVIQLKMNRLKTSIDVSNLLSGLYVIEVCDENAECFRDKLVIE
ncbi:endonuclease [Psychroflexus salis]|nr:endonuclease [Psychroflexus salis]